jgi:predicted KAP-like P-loop ATPase
VLLNKVGDVALGGSPWEGDPFDRKSFGEILTRLIQSLDKSCVISLRGEWGSGKTVFLRRFEAHLESNGIKTIHIDAWKTDYLDDPMTAFISATNARIEKHVEGDKTASEFAEAIIRSLASAGVKIIAPAAKLVGTVFLPGADKVIEASADLVKDAGSYFFGEGARSTGC